MSAVVDTQTHGDDEVNAGDSVHGEAPEVHESADVSQRQDDHLRKVNFANQVILRLYQISGLF